MKKFLALSALAVASSSASALVISPSNWGPCVGTNSCTIGSQVTLSTAPSSLNFLEKDAYGAKGLGVTGAEPGEIRPREFINVTFRDAQVVEFLEIVFLYNGPEFNDPKEIAVVGADNQTFKLKTTSTDNVAVWDGLGTVSSCGGTFYGTGGTGCFRIDNPFGDTEISVLSFTAEIPDDSKWGQQADFAIGKIGTVPEPTTLALLGAGLCGLGFARRKTA